MIPYQKFHIYGTIVLVADKPEPAKEPFWITSTVDEGASIAIAKNAAGTDSRDFEYSYDLTEWIKFTWTTSTSTSNVKTRTAGEKLYIRNNAMLGNPDDINDYIKLKLTATTGSKIKFGGVLGSLWNDFETNTVYSRACNKLFDNISVDVNYDELVFPTNLAINCYYSMFSYNKLTKAPHIVVTDSTIPEKSFYNIFKGCTNLTDISGIDISNCTTVETQALYGMFNGCTSLNTVLKLPMINLGNAGYSYMYNGCSTLKVFTEAGEGHMIPWTIPTTGTFVTAPTSGLQSNMFNEIITDSVPGSPSFRAGNSYTYYVENEPV